MSTGVSRDNGVERDAEKVEEKFGPFADVYAETRSEAADIAGDEAEKNRWKEVAADVRKDDAGDAEA